MSLLQLIAYVITQGQRALGGSQAPLAVNPRECSREVSERSHLIFLAPPLQGILCKRRKIGRCSVHIPHCSPRQPRLFEYRHVGFDLFVLRPSSYKIESPVQVRNGLSIGVAHQVILSGLPQILYGPTLVVSLFEVHRKLGRNFIGELAVELFAPRSNQLMKPRATAAGHPLIQHLLVECVDEDVAR